MLLRRHQKREENEATMYTKQLIGMKEEAIYQWRGKHEILYTQNIERKLMTDYMIFWICLLCSDLTGFIRPQPIDRPWSETAVRQPHLGRKPGYVGWAESLCLCSCSKAGRLRGRENGEQVTRKRQCGNFAFMLHMHGKIDRRRIQLCGNIIGNYSISWVEMLNPYPWLYGIYF